MNVPIQLFRAIFRESCQVILATVYYLTSNKLMIIVVEIPRHRSKKWVFIRNKDTIITKIYHILFATEALYVKVLSSKESFSFVLFTELKAFFFDYSLDSGEQLCGELIRHKKRFLTNKV